MTRGSPPDTDGTEEETNQPSSSGQSGTPQTPRSSAVTRAVSPPSSLLQGSFGRFDAGDIGAKADFHDAGVHLPTFGAGARMPMWFKKSKSPLPP